MHYVCTEGDDYFLEPDESNPDENNWWAEAIVAYTAWSYEEYFQSDVVIGIIDTGFQLNKP